MITSIQHILLLASCIFINIQRKDGVVEFCRPSVRLTTTFIIQHSAQVTEVQFLIFHQLQPTRDKAGWGGRGGERENSSASCRGKETAVLMQNQILSLIYPIWFMPLLTYRSSNEGSR